jgi:hypothetical protein
MSKKKIPLKKALMWLFLCSLTVNGTALAGLLFYRYVKGQYAQDDTYRIVAIVQTTPEKESLKSVYLAEILGLSIDHPTNLYRFNSKEARQRLLKHPLFEKARIKKIRPATIQIDYTLRKPIAYLLDNTNTAIDSEGFPFPLKPFFTPKKLPEIYLGTTESTEESPINSMQWGKQLKGPRVELAMNLFQLISSQYCSDSQYLKRIDVSKAHAPSYGQRQVIVILEKQLVKELKGQSILVRVQHILRLDTKNYIQGLENYVKLKPHLEGLPIDITDSTLTNIDLPPIIIDLRLPHLAYFTKSKL